MTYNLRFHKLNDVIDRFEAKYIPEPNSGCWIWTATTNQDGYGRFRFRGKLMGAHRFSMMIYTEQENKNMCVCHTCDNPCCVNPAHLFFATHKENMEDKSRKGRVGFNPVKGTQHHNSKLTECDILKIRELLSSGLSQSKIGLLYGVSQGCIGTINQGITWKHI
jgi:hypothetical protein